MSKNTTKKTISTKGKVKDRVVAKGWAVIVDNEVIAAPCLKDTMVDDDICSFAIFHTKKEAQTRKSWLAPSIQKEAKITYLTVYL